MSSSNRGFAASQGAGGSGAMRALRGPGKKPPPLMDPTRERDTHRILALFKPYRIRLAGVLVLIVIAAAPLVRHRRATAGARRPSRARAPAKIKRSDYYWQSRNLAHLAPKERISRGLPSVHREEDWE